MYCRNCGAQLPDDSRFCDRCGTPTGVEAVQQPVNQQRSYQQQGYQQQGYQQQNYRQQNYQQPYQQNYAPQATGALLDEVEKVSRYNGGGAIGPVTGTGDLFIYDDHIEFNKKTGDQRGYMFGPIVGMVTTMHGAKKKPVDVYEYSDIASVRTGKYAGVMGTLVLELKNKKKVSFTIGKGGKKKAEELCDLISQYL